MQIEFRSSRGHEAQTPSTQPSTINSEPTEPSLLTSAATIVESRLHAVERVPSEGRGKPSQFIPIRFIYRNKLTLDDRLLLAFDAFVLSETFGRAVSLGKIIHGDSRASLKVKTAALVNPDLVAADVRRLILSILHGRIPRLDLPLRLEAEVARLASPRLSDF